MAAFITGGGSGIGLASAQWLVRDGCAVTIVGRTEAKLAGGADALRADAPAGVDVRTVACDVADEAAVRAAVATASGSSRRAAHRGARRGHGHLRPDADH